MTAICISEWSIYPAPGSPALPASVLFDSSSPEPLLRDQIAALAKGGMLTIDDYRAGLVIKSSSFVGKVAIGGLEVTIQPKIQGAPFLRLLRYAYGLRNLTLINHADFSVTELSFQDLLIYQLLLEATELISRGLRREYIRHEMDLAVPRGRINIGAIALRGAPKSTLPCTTHDRGEDILLNQVLLAGIIVAARLVETQWLRTKLNRLRAMIDSAISPVRISHELIAKARSELTRLTSVYEPSLELIGLILQGQGISLSADSDRVRLPGFLFDMNRFFQRLVSQFLREHLPHFTLQDEHRIHEMMRYDPAHNPRNRQSPKPRPDFMVTKNGQILSILDAKYRDLWQRELPRDMLYQLAIYALSQSTHRTAAILYPTIEPMTREAQIIVNNPLDEATSARVILRPLNLLKLDELLYGESSATPVAEVGRMLFAQQLAFGTAVLQ